MPEGTIQHVKDEIKIMTEDGMDLYYYPDELPEEIRYFEYIFDFEIYMCSHFCPLGFGLQDLGKCKEFVNWYKKEVEKIRNKEKERWEEMIDEMAKQRRKSP